MKGLMIGIGLGCAMMVLVMGCGKKEETPMTPSTAPSMEKPVATAVKDMVADVKDDIAKAMALAKEGKYTEALALLQKRSDEVQNNPEAKKLSDDAIGEIKKMMTDAAAKKVESTATKALGDLMPK